MNKSEPGKRLADRPGMTQATVANAVDGVFDVIGDAQAEGEEVWIQGFGSFVTGKRAARAGRNPGTGEVLSLLASTMATFKAGKVLKDAVGRAEAS